MFGFLNSMIRLGASLYALHLGANETTLGILVAGFVGGAVLLSYATLPEVEYLPSGNRNLVFGLLLPPPGYNMNQVLAMGEVIEDHTRRYWDLDPYGPEARDLDFPAVRDFFYVAFGRGAFLGLRAADPLRAAELIPLIRQVGFQGLCTHGEESALNPPAELNYHVYAALAQNAHATPDEIAVRSVGALYGDAELAAEALTAFQEHRVPRGLPPRVARALAVAEGQTRVRLNWLWFELQRLAERAR